MRIALATYREHPDYTEDDRLLATYLKLQSEHVSPVIWDDTEVKWDSYDLIIFRSVWDYFIRRVQFDAWLDHLQALPVRVFNLLPTIQWNKNKTYFNRFNDLGVRIPEYQIIKRNMNSNLASLLELNGWNKAVIKPAISGGAYNTWVTDKNHAAGHQLDFEKLLSEQDVIVQKFSAEIAESGEWSLIYFNKKFSHAVCKKAKPGEFRVQAQFGGRHHGVIPDPNLLSQVEHILSLIEEPLLYARVDGYLDNEYRFYLMELELIEPVLFFDSHPAACSNFYAALKQLI